MCSLESEIQQGDHVVAFGRVVAGGFDEQAEPLVYYRSAYQSLTGERSRS